MSQFRLVELERRLANLLRVGVVAALDAPGARVRVSAGGVLTAWLPWLTWRAGPDKSWWAPEAGEQVLLLAPMGELAQAVVLPALYSAANPQPADSADKHRVEYQDGTSVEYDRASGVLTVDCVGDVVVKGARTLLVEFGGDVTVRTPTQVTVDAPQATFTGAVTVQGLLTYLAGMAGSGGDGATATINGDVVVVGGDVTADGIGLKPHRHMEQGDGAPTGPAIA